MGYLGNNALPFDPIRSSGRPRDAQRFSGNGSTTTFTLNFSVFAPTDLEVFVENVQQEPLFSYDAIGNQLIFTEAPPSGTNNIYVVYKNVEAGIYNQIPDGSISYQKLANNIRVFTTDNYTGDNTTTAFTLTERPADANTLFVSIDGVVQRAPIHYTVSNTTITFASAPPSSSNVHVRHLGFRTTSTITALAANTTISQPVISGGTITGATIVTANINGATTVSGNLTPSANTTYDLGSASLRWANIYTGDLHLSNEGRNSGNLVDGTKGNWTVQEGETDLYLINNITGKKYKFAIEEIK